LRPDWRFDVLDNQIKSEANFQFYLRYRFSRTTRTSSSCSSCCVRPALAAVECIIPPNLDRQPMTVTSGVNPSTTKGFHVFRVAVAWLSERLPLPDRLCDQELVFFHAASDDCFHLPACCVPNRVEKEKSFCCD
jgi:hypothetical protein